MIVLENIISINDGSISLAHLWRSPPLWIWNIINLNTLLQDVNAVMSFFNWMLEDTLTEALIWYKDRLYYTYRNHILLFVVVLFKISLLFSTVLFIVVFSMFIKPKDSKMSGCDTMDNKIYYFIIWYDHITKSTCSSVYDSEWVFDTIFAN